MNGTPTRTVAAILLLCASTAAADRGLVPLRPGVKVFEPVQQALVAWNGTEEYLLLSTDVHASGETEVLEFLPLPSEPTVEQGDRELLRRATSLINQRLMESRHGRLGYEGKGRPAGVVTFEGRIGVHQITVARVLDAGGFAQWVEQVLGRDRPDDFVLPPSVVRGVEDYLEDDFRWFVFDVIRVGDEAASTDALLYRFATDKLYYPLRATSTASGRSSIRLLVLSSKLLRQFDGWPSRRVDLLHAPIKLVPGDIRQLGGGLEELFSEEERPWLRIWEIEAELSDFDRDLLAR
jgi:hypothetical protein